MTDANHPVTDLVILAGGQARRMQGLNKLLQCFDKQIQLLKISQHFRGKPNNSGLAVTVTIGFISIWCRTFAVFRTMKQAFLGR
jgi:hypothetical protein